MYILYHLLRSDAIQKHTVTTVVGEVFITENLRRRKFDLKDLILI